MLVLETLINTKIELAITESKFVEANKAKSMGEGTITWEDDNLKWAERFIQLAERYDGFFNKQLGGTFADCLLPKR